MNSHLDTHLLTLILIMIIAGAFGGFLNYLHNFDTNDDVEQKNKLVKYKYVFLGIGSSFLVPAFLKMIASDLIIDNEKYDSISYLIFAGFCLIAAIFSRRFISTIGEKILEAAKKAEKTSSENKKQLETTKLELTSTQERIEDVKLAVNLKTLDAKESPSLEGDENPLNSLLSLVDSYIERTRIPDYSERLKLKSEIGRKMGQIIVRYNLSKEELLNKYPKEGMYLALAYSVDLRPDEAGLSILDQVAKKAIQLYTKYIVLNAYKTLANSGLIKKDHVKNIYKTIIKFRESADNALLRNIEDTINILKFIEPEM